jgi:hypothetical protein
VTFETATEGFEFRKMRERAEAAVLLLRNIQVAIFQQAKDTIWLSPTQTAFDAISEFTGLPPFEERVNPEEGD